MITPSMVRMARSLLLSSESSAVRKLSEISTPLPSCLPGPGRAQAALLPARLAAVFGLAVVTDDHAVAQGHGAGGARCHLGRVGHHDDGDPLAVQLIEQGH